MTILNYRDCGLPEGAVFIGRPSYWGNPFRIKQGVTREKAIALYRTDLWERIRNGEINREELAALHGKDLVCYCTPKACHGFVLEKAATWAREWLSRQGSDLQPSA